MQQTLLEIGDVFEFGKYKGCDVEDVIGDDPDYMEWLYDNEVIEFGDHLVSVLEGQKII